MHILVAVFVLSNANQLAKEAEVFFTQTSVIRSDLNKIKRSFYTCYNVKGYLPSEELRDRLLCPN